MKETLHHDSLNAAAASDVLLDRAVGWFGRFHRSQEIELQGIGQRLFDTEHDSSIQLQFILEQLIRDGFDIKAKLRLLCPISGVTEPCSGILRSDGVEGIGDGLIEGFFSSRLDAAKELLEF